jgi:hypothetical protein
VLFDGAASVLSSIAAALRFAAGFLGEVILVLRFRC